MRDYFYSPKHRFAAIFFRALQHMSRLVQTLWNCNIVFVNDLVQCLQEKRFQFLII